MRKTKKQGREEAEQKAVEFLAHTRRRARSNRNCVFLLSQVSHGGEIRKERWGKYGGKCNKKEEGKSRFSRVRHWDFEDIH